MREKLSNLDSYISTIKLDIYEFNRYVKFNYQGIQSKGEKCAVNIMIHLFKAYFVASDREFVSYIKLKKMEHKEGRNVLNKYTILYK